jgi:NADH-quinone oxidoreductase subunit M
MADAGYPVLTSLIFMPLVASVVLFFIRQDGFVRGFTLVVGILECLLALPLFGFQPGGGYQFVEKAAWIPAWDITYHLGLDGLSLFMVMLTAVLLPLCVLCSWTYIKIRIKEFHFCLLLMTSACVGVFTALDFVLFYIFWEAMLVPMYLLIAVWGGPERKYPPSSSSCTPWPGPPCFWRPSWPSAPWAARSTSPP